MKKNERKLGEEGCVGFLCYVFVFGRGGGDGVIVGVGIVCRQVLSVVHALSELFFESLYCCFSGNCVQHLIYIFAFS